MVGGARDGHLAWNAGNKILSVKSKNSIILEEGQSGLTTGLLFVYHGVNELLLWSPSYPKARSNIREYT